jgi:predicted transcriptional regulator
MSTLELKRELHEFVDKGDDKFLKMLYEKVNDYIELTNNNTKIREGEDDIKKGRLYSLDEVREIVNKL